MIPSAGYLSAGTTGRGSIRPGNGHQHLHAIVPCAAQHRQRVVDEQRRADVEVHIILQGMPERLRLLGVTIAVRTVNAVEVVGQARNGVFQIERIRV